MQIKSIVDKAMKEAKKDKPRKKGKSNLDLASLLESSKAKIIVAGVGVANIMFVLVQDSTRQIGIKMAVGAKPRYILRQYILEGVALVLAGGLLGLLFSWIVLWLLRQIPVSEEGLAYLGRPELSLTTALIVSSVLTLIALAAGFFPARHAASVDPVEALRYE